MAVAATLPELSEWTLQLGVERCGSVSPLCRYGLTIISVKILH